MKVFGYILPLLLLVFPCYGFCEEGDGDTLKRAFDAMSPCDGSTEGANGKATLLFDNPLSWATRWWMLENARDTVDATYYIVQKDVFGMSFLGHLLYLADRGVNIRLMIDRKGSIMTTGAGTGADYLQELAGHGIAVKVYGTLRKSMGNNLRKLVKAMFSSEKTPTQSFTSTNHDKIFVVDKVYSLLGGRNISKDYFPVTGETEKAYDDADILFQSPEIASAINYAFEVELKNSANRDIKPDIALFDKKRDIELIGAFLLMDRWIKSPALSEKGLSQLKNDETFRGFAIKCMVTDVLNALKHYGITRTPKKREIKKITKLAKELVCYPSLRGKGDYNPLKNLTDVPKIKIIDKVSNLGDAEDTLQPGLYSLFDGAKESILLKNPYVLLTSEFALSLKRASRRGVRITIVTNSPLSGDSDLVEGFLISKWYKYLAAIPQLRLKVVGGTVPIHSKVGVIDGRICLIGSYNLDYLSANVNGEILSALWSEKLAAEMETFILSGNEENTELVEYTIRRDVRGFPIDSDPSTPEIEPYIIFGPKEHVPPGFWKACVAKATQSRIVEKFIPGVDTLE